MRKSSTRQLTMSQNTPNLRVRPRVSYDKNAKCIICLNSLGTQVNEIKILSCGHIFHRTCVNGWFERDMDTNTCPTCRNDAHLDTSAMIDDDKSDNYNPSDDKRQTRRKRKRASKTTRNSKRKVKRRGTLPPEYDAPFMTTTSNVESFFLSCLSQKTSFDQSFTWTLNPYLWREYILADHICVVSYSTMGIVYTCKYCKTLKWSLNMQEVPVCTCDGYSQDMLMSDDYSVSHELNRQDSNVSVRTDQSNRHLTSLRDCISSSVQDTQRHIQLQHEQLMHNNIPQIMYAVSRVIGAQHVKKFSVLLLCPFYSVYKCRKCQDIIGVSIDREQTLDEHTCTQK